MERQSLGEVELAGFDDFPLVPKPHSPRFTLSRFSGWLTGAADASKIGRLEVSEIKGTFSNCKKKGIMKRG